MWFRRAIYRWLFPAVLVLPLWLLLGWGIFSAGGWAFLWVLFIALPSVAAGQLAVALLVRLRPSVRAERAVSWQDAAGIVVWHALTVLVGCFIEPWFGLTLALAIIAAVGVLALSLRQLRREAAAGRSQVVWTEQTFTAADPRRDRPSGPHGGGRAIPPSDVIIVTDAEPDEDRRPR